LSKNGLKTVKFDFEAAQAALSILYICAKQYTWGLRTSPVRKKWL